jgi:hypothetical protein
MLRRRSSIPRLCSRVVSWATSLARSRFRTMRAAFEGLVTKRVGDRASCSSRWAKCQFSSWIRTWEEPSKVRSFDAPPFGWWRANVLAVEAALLSDGLCAGRATRRFGAAARASNGEARTRGVSVSRGGTAGACSRGRAMLDSEPYLPSTMGDPASLRTRLAHLLRSRATCLSRRSLSTYRRWTALCNGLGSAGPRERRGDGGSRTRCMSKRCCTSMRWCLRLHPKARPCALQTSRATMEVPLAEATLDGCVPAGEPLRGACE